MEPRSIHEVFQGVLAAHGPRVAYRYKRDGRWHDLSWNEHGRAVARIAKALIALGVNRGDRVAVLAQTRLEWLQCDLAITTSGAVSVGIYPSNLGPDCAYIVNHADTAVVFVENAEQLQKLLGVRAEMPGLRQLILFDGPGDPARGVLGWQEFLDRGDDVPDTVLEERGRRIEPGDVASLVYTSGTTGIPKGVMITHRNLVFTTWSAGECLYLEPHFQTLLFLPLAHVFARLIAYCCLRAAIPVAVAENMSKVADNLKEIRPQFITSVPRIYEKVHEKITTGVAAAGGLRKKLFDWSLGVGLRVSRLEQQGRSVPARLALGRAVADRLVFRKVRAALGGRLVWAISGAAPLNPTIAEFFDACGVPVLEGLGMTENTSFSNVNPLGRNKFGTVGPVGPGIEMKIAEDGEVLFRGDNVMAGYFKNEAATAEVIDADGWLHTGDIGEIDGDGYLRITDRKKDLIITAGGKNVAPQRIERILRTSPFIAQVMAYGDKRKFISALVTLDVDNVRRWAGENGLGGLEPRELATHPRVEELIRGEIEERNRQLASFESVKKFRILAQDFSVEAGELTPTLKIKRKVVIEKYRELLDQMYAA